MAIVSISAPIKRFVDNKMEIVVNSTKLFDALKEIDNKYPHFLSKVCDTDGKIYPYVDIFINDKSVDKITGVESNIADKDEICMIPAMND